MNPKPLRCLAAIFILTAFTTGASAVYADSFDCFPLCEQQAPPPLEISCAQSDTERAASAEETIKQVEAANQQLKTAKKRVGYVRSPESLAIKLFNDHVFKIPAWIGYVVDPLGTLKGKALAEVRNFAKDSITENIRNHAARAACDTPGNEVTIAGASSS